MLVLSQKSFTHLPLSKVRGVELISSIILFTSGRMELLLIFSHTFASIGEIGQDGIRNLKKGLLFLNINTSGPQATATAKKIIYRVGVV